MRINVQNCPTSYMRKNYDTCEKNMYGNIDSADTHVNLKRKLLQAGNSTKDICSTKNNVLSNAMSYSEKLRMQRENDRYADLQKKKLKYQFKDISSKIIRSKTSQAARQAVNSAKREILRLKKEKASGEYDPEEIEAAISHAKAMERVAKKKVRHLEEEEMAKASGGPCSDIEVEREEKTAKEEPDSGEYEETDYELCEESMTEEQLMNSYTRQAVILSELGERMENMMSEFDESTEDMLSEFGESMEDMMSELEEGMADMLSEMGLDELSDSLLAVKGDMDPEDMKMMKIKHRCKEMKEMTEADAEYMKVIFEHFSTPEASAQQMTGVDVYV